MANGSPDEGRTWWLDRKENVTKVARTLYVVCALLLLADFIIHRHAETDVDGLFGFYAFYGFLGSVFLVLSAKELLRRFVKRSEDYYDD